MSEKPKSSARMTMIFGFSLVWAGAEETGRSRRSDRTGRQLMSFMGVEKVLYTHFRREVPFLDEV
jgi:hypothetical protein